VPRPNETFESLHGSWPSCWLPAAAADGPTPHLRVILQAETRNEKTNGLMATPFDDGPRDECITTDFLNE
jgi:hypothetical protein